MKAILPAMFAGFFACAACSRAICTDSLAPGVAQLAAPFDEVLTDTAGRDAKFSGYFTGVAVRGDSGRMLRNAHWSLVHPKSP